MKKLETIVRIVLGLLILVSGINKFGYWINVAYMSDALKFAVDIATIGGEFLIYALAILEILIGIALIINKFKLLAILSLVPLMVFILAFHLFLDVKGILIAAIVFALNIYLLYQHKSKVTNIFNMNSSD